MARAAMNRIAARLRQYTDHADPRAALAGAVALLVASNQPFYPLYIQWTASSVIWPAYFTFLTTPFFLLVPVANRLDPRFGKALLLAAGLGNTLLCQTLFGYDSGVGVFAMPCLALAFLLFSPAERGWSFALAALALAICALPDGALGGPLHRYEDASYAALRRLNILSAATLTAAIVFMSQRGEVPAAEAARGASPDPSATR